MSTEKNEFDLDEFRKKAGQSSKSTNKLKLTPVNESFGLATEYSSKSDSNTSHKNKYNKK